MSSNCPWRPAGQHDLQQAERPAACAGSTVWGQTPGRPLLRAEAGPNTCCGHDIDAVGQPCTRCRQHRCPPAEPVGELLSNEAVIHVESREHGQTGDVAGLCDEPERQQRRASVSNGAARSQPQQGKCSGQQRVDGGPGCSSFGAASAQAPESSVTQCGLIIIIITKKVDRRGLHWGPCWRAGSAVVSCQGPTCV